MTRLGIKFIVKLDTSIRKGKKKGIVKYEIQFQLSIRRGRVRPLDAFEGSS